MTIAVMLVGFVIMLGGGSCACRVGRRLAVLVFSAVLRGLVFLVLLAFVYLLVLDRWGRRTEAGPTVPVHASNLYTGGNR